MVYLAKIHFPRITLKLGKYLDAWYGVNRKLFTELLFLLTVEGRYLEDAIHLFSKDYELLSYLVRFIILRIIEKDDPYFLPSIKLGHCFQIQLNYV